MNEFSLIDTYFKKKYAERADVILGIGDDAACLVCPTDKHLLVSCDTLVSEVHFLKTWDPYDIAYKAVMVNVSDMAAMAASPCWLTLALTLEMVDENWLQRFSQGLFDALGRFNIALVGGDTTHGPLSMTLTIHGLVKTGCAVRRDGAKAEDKIYVSGSLGAAAMALNLSQYPAMSRDDAAIFLDKLTHPIPRIELGPILQAYATAAIDISDGLSADLHHICVASQLGARLYLDQIPCHPLLQSYEPHRALEFALHGGDDYELCFTVPKAREAAFLKALQNSQWRCYCIGLMEENPGLRGVTLTGEEMVLTPRGYNHFEERVC